MAESKTTSMTASLRVAAAKSPRRIGLADAADPRMIAAAIEAVKVGLPAPVLIGDSNKIRASGLPDAIEIIDPEVFGRLSFLAELLFSRKRNRYATPDEAQTAIKENTLLFAALLVLSGELDGLLAGSLSTTSAVIRAALTGIGLSDGIQTLSSFFLMDFPVISGIREQNFCWAFADCGVVIDPDAVQLADIAISTTANYETLTANAAHVALLSFSTKGSAHSESTEKIAAALELVRQKAPHLNIDGELQFDAAIIAGVAERKAPQSEVAGRANVFIFPDLDAGNIGYKIAERLAGAKAIGPIMQGLAKPMNDLSRGANVEEIVTMLAITALQVEPNKE